ncbi:MAG: hypothetical protein RL653_378 [Pseudomonadota bacterium]
MSYGEPDYEQATAGIRTPSPVARWTATALALGVCAGLLFILGKGFGRNPHEVPFALVGKPAPTFTLRRLDTGAPFSFEQMRGRPAVINFWASWCGPCKAEHPVLHWAAQRFGTRVQFVGVVFEDSENNAKAFLRDHGIPFPQLVDPESRTAVSYGVAGVPETYFIDAAGNIHGKHVGPLTQEAFITEVKAILGEGGP